MQLAYLVQWILTQRNRRPRMYVFQAEDVKWGAKSFLLVYGVTPCKENSVRFHWMETFAEEVCRHSFQTRMNCGTKRAAGLYFLH